MLRPPHLPPDAKTPVILSVGPYFSHIGQTGNDRFSGTGPSERFNDLIEGADLKAKGYTVVMVDLRGFGGSTGCLDWVGPGEQADVQAAVDCSASQPWSSGKVGMYGKSYDAVTGLVGANQKRPGLHAVVAQEPLWDMYNYLFSNGVRRPNYLGTPRAYNGIANLTGMPDDSDRYKANAAYETSHPECLANNLTDTQDPDPSSDYWQARDLAAMAKGSQVPLFVTQGFIEANTKPEDIQQYLDNHAGPERGWLGQWDHVRGNDTNDSGVLEMGRAGWFDEVMRYYDLHLKGINPVVVDPDFAIEDSLGKWRAQDTWPETIKSTTVRLQPGNYVDDGGRSSTAPQSAPDAGTWDMEHAPDLPPGQSERGFGPKPRTTDDGNAYYVWSRPVNRPSARHRNPPCIPRDDGGGQRARSAMGRRARRHCSDVRRADVHRARRGCQVRPQVDRLDPRSGPSTRSRHRHQHDTVLVGQPVEADHQGRFGISRPPTAERTLGRWDPGGPVALPGQVPPFIHRLVGGDCAGLLPAQRPPRQELNPPENGKN